VFGDQSFDRFSDAILHKNQVGYGDAVMSVDVPGQRSERAVWHPNNDRRHMFERIGHRKQKNIHRALPFNG
jgi:hypothetical protein